MIPSLGLARRITGLRYRRRRGWIVPWRLLVTAATVFTRHEVSKLKWRRVGQVFNVTKESSLIPWLAGCTMHYAGQAEVMWAVMHRIKTSKVFSPHWWELLFLIRQINWKTCQIVLLLTFCLFSMDVELWRHLNLSIKSISINYWGEVQQTWKYAID